MKQWIARIFRYAGLFIGLLLIVVLGKSFLHKSRQTNIPWGGLVMQDTAAFSRLAQSIRFQTISYDDSIDPAGKMLGLILFYNWLETSYPMVHKHAIKQQIGTGSYIFTLKGKNPSLKPCLFLAHIDVVPVDSVDKNKWKYPPFAGKIVGDTLWGRGSQDDKFVALAMMEALEHLLVQGKHPEHTLIFAFGHDEETNGKLGAGKIAAYLQKQNIRAEFIADEGFGVTEGLVPGMDKPVALIGISEKGDASFKLTVTMSGGHSSMPKTENANSVLAKALSKLDEYVFPAQTKGPVSQMFETLAPEMNYGYKVLFSNLWLTSSIVNYQLAQNEKTNASIRTTHVTTILNSGNKENVIPREAMAVVNFRIIPGETVQSVQSAMEKVIADPRVKTSLYANPTEPGPISSAESTGWKAIEQAVRKTYPNTIVAPGLVVTGTDCKNYTAISSDIYRFVPFRITSDNIGGIHGINEHLPLRDYSEGIAFYQYLFGSL
jgi:carboxypeptidase PM20D1